MFKNLSNQDKAKLAAFVIANNLVWIHILNTSVNMQMELRNKARKVVDLNNILADIITEKDPRLLRDERLQNFMTDFKFEKIVDNIEKGKQ